MKDAREFFQLLFYAAGTIALILAIVSSLGVDVRDVFIEPTRTMEIIIVTPQSQGSLIVIPTEDTGPAPTMTATARPAADMGVGDKTNKGGK